jgi:hypothetical protein
MMSGSQQQRQQHSISDFTPNPAVLRKIVNLETQEKTEFGSISKGGDQPTRPR